MYFLVMNFIAVEYHENMLFYGDIKPDNIFFNDFYGAAFMTSDVGSLLFLGETTNENDLFMVTSYTEYFASPGFIEAVKNKTPLTRE